MVGFGRHTARQAEDGPGGLWPQSDPAAARSPRPGQLTRAKKCLLEGVQITCVCMRAKSLQSCLTLCDRLDGSPPGSSVHEILLARILESVAMPSSRGSSPPGDQNCVSCGSCIAGRFFTAEPPGKPPYLAYLASKSPMALFCPQYRGQGTEPNVQDLS